MDKLKMDIVLDLTQNDAECPREKTLRQIFGLGNPEQKRTLHKGIEIPLHGITYITGYSGSGKSSLLRQLTHAFPEALTSVPEIHQTNSVLNCFDATVEETISWLGHFGLGEAQLLLTPVNKLSVGQKERLNLALMLWSKPKKIIIDEFLSSLDRLTARIISYQFQKLARRMGITCYIATAHSDLGDALFPDTRIYLDLEGVHSVTENPPNSSKLSEMLDIQIEDGSIDDYKSLSRFHYMDSQIGDECINEQNVARIRRAQYKGTTVGVRIFNKIYPSSYEKVGIFKWINDRALLSSRVVVHPAFRGLGISKMLDLPFQPNSQIQAIFTHSALARYFPFDMNGGYQMTHHVSETKTQYHCNYESALKDMGLSNPEQLNSPEGAKTFWDGLSSQNRSKIKSLLTSLLTDYDMRYFRYIGSELNIELSGQNANSLNCFFHQKIASTPTKEFWKLLSEGLYFPMQGLIRRNKEHSI